MADAKQLTARLCVLCHELYGQYFDGVYTKPQEEFRDWMNEKTGLDLDHTKDKEGALAGWVERLEAIRRREV